MKKSIYICQTLCFIFLFCWSKTTFADEQDLSVTQTPIFPGHLKVGDTVGLVSSAFAAKEEQQIEFSKERLQALGFKVIEGKHIHDRYGYLAGEDKARAQDINDMFANPKVKGIFEVRGGWGSARVLPYLNYDLIKQNPKVLMGFSDITSLLLAIHKQTGLVTFHGPLGGWYPWPQYTINYFKKVVMQGKQVDFFNPTSFDNSKDLIQTENRIHTIHGGVATGRLIGGNLSILTTMIGTPYMPNIKGAILFVEDTDRYYYEIDRMMDQLKNAGVLNQISGFVFGQCTDCNALLADESLHSFTLNEILDQYIKPLGIPAWSGAMINHSANIFVLPEGVQVKVDANKGSIQMLNSAVS